MLDTLISSKTRIKLLLKFFINPELKAYLRGLTTEFGESSNSIRVELNKFEKAGMINYVFEGNKKVFKVNQVHPLFGDVRNMILKHVGIDSLIEGLVKRIGKPEKVYLNGEFAKGINSNVIDITIIGDIDKTYLFELVGKVEKELKKKIKYLVYSTEEAKDLLFDKEKSLLLWTGPLPQL